LAITKDSIPKEVALSGNTAYAILEEHSIDKDGNTAIERFLVDFNLPNVTVRFLNEKGFALTHWIPLKNVPAPVN
jgi:hypothetical protein